MVSKSKLENLKEKSKFIEETTKEIAIELLADHVAQGLDLTFPEPDRWSMRYKDRNDSGTMRMPPRTLIYCATKLMKK